MGAREGRLLANRCLKARLGYDHNAMNQHANMPSELRSRSVMKIGREDSRFSDIAQRSSRTVFETAWARGKAGQQCAGRDGGSGIELLTAFPVIYRLIKLSQIARFEIGVRGRSHLFQLQTLELVGHELGRPILRWHRE